MEIVVLSPFSHSLIDLYRFCRSLLDATASRARRTRPARGGFVWLLIELNATLLYVHLLPSPSNLDAPRASERCATPCTEIPSPSFFSTSDKAGQRCRNLDVTRQSPTRRRPMGTPVRRLVPCHKVHKHRRAYFIFWIFFLHRLRASEVVYIKTRSHTIAMREV